MRLFHCCENTVNSNRVPKALTFLQQSGNIVTRLRIVLNGIFLRSIKNEVINQAFQQEQIHFEKSERCKTIKSSLTFKNLRLLPGFRTIDNVTSMA